LALLLIFLFTLEQTGIASALSGQVQEGEFTNGLKVAGTGYFEVGVSVKDRNLALEYNSFMTGDGDLEMDTGTVESQRAGRLPGMSNDSTIPLNLWENTRITYSGTTPMVGTKYINSKSFWGGIGAEVQESVSVTEMEREGSTFFASTNPSSYTADPNEIARLLSTSPVDSVGISTRNSFNGTWQTDAHLHKMFSKDVKVHESFTGTFDVEKRLVFRDDPAKEKREAGCEGIDC
jgi:hypothetical protein